MENIGKLLQSGENYLECILILSQRQGNVRSIDVARYFDYSKPSVSIAMKQLKTANLIEVDESGVITLTSTGQQAAEKIYDRHKALTTLLTDLGVNAETAEKDACAMEHCISEESFQKIMDFVKKNAK